MSAINKERKDCFINNNVNAANKTTKIFMKRNADAMNTATLHVLAGTDVLKNDDDDEVAT